MADQELIERLKKNEEQAWTDFFFEFDPLIRSVVCWKKWNFDEHMRADVSQKIRVELTEHVDRLEGKACLETYIKKICMYRCVDQIRKRVRRGELFVPLFESDRDGEEYERPIAAGDDFDPVREVALAERAEATHEALAAISEICATAIRHFYIDDLSYKQIAKKLGIAVNTVGSRLAKCLAKLRDVVRENPVLREDFRFEERA